MKISGYYKEQNEDVKLITEYNEEKFKDYDMIFLSKVFTDTEVPEWVLKLDNISYGGTGFFFDKAPNLPDEIEHHMPDYDLYTDWVNNAIQSIIDDKKAKGKPYKESSIRTQFKEYTDYSIGFITRGCFRKCPFCVNQKYNKVEPHSPLSEFYNNDRKKICLLDDNFFGCLEWKRLMQELIDTGKPFKFKQGLDERILTPEKCNMLFKANYDGDITFAFDNIADMNVIKNKIELIRKYTDQQCVFYVLCAFDRQSMYDEEFWISDMVDTLERIRVLQHYKMLPYIMRFEKYNDAPEPYKGMYITLARWCNQFSFMKKNTFRQYVMEVKSNGVGSSAWRYMTAFEEKHPDIAQKYFDLKWGEI